MKLGSTLHIDSFRGGRLGYELIHVTFKNGSNEVVESAVKIWKYHHPLLVLPGTAS